MESKSQRDLRSLHQEASGSPDARAVAPTNPREDRSGDTADDSSDSSSVSSQSSSESSGSATAASRSRSTAMQIEHDDSTLEGLQQRLELAPRRFQHPGTVAPKPHNVLKRISLKDETLPEENTALTVAYAPIESFGQKLLKDMGMGDPTRDLGVDKRPTEPILFVPRPEGMGIGAVSKQALLGMIRQGKEVTDKDLRARHTEHVTGIKREEKPEDPHTCRLLYGEEVTIIDGKYHDLLAKIVGGDGIGVAGELIPREEDNLTETEIGNKEIVVQLVINAKNVKMLRRQVVKGRLTQLEPENADGEKGDKDKKKKKHKWVRPGLVCRIVSQKYQQGKYMDELGQIIDVPDCYTVSFQTQSQELLEDIQEKYLETVMPLIGEKVMILKNEHAGQLGILNERKKKENKVTVKITLPDGGIDYIHMTQEDCCAVAGSKLKS